MNLEKRWRRLWQRLADSDPEPEFRRLAAYYTKPHRHYHNLSHICHCLVLFDEIRTQSRNPDALETAIWFHDVIYRPYCSGNEAASAAWADRSLANGGAASPDVRRLILATEHREPAASPDEELITDIDLAILGSDPALYRAYAQQIHREYWLIPLPRYRTVRGRVLAGFLRRPHIFTTPYFRERFEMAARRNLHAEKTGFGL